MTRFSSSRVARISPGHEHLLFPAYDAEGTVLLSVLHISSRVVVYFFLSREAAMSRHLVGAFVCLRGDAKRSRRRSSARQCIAVGFGAGMLFPYTARAGDS